MHSVSIVGCGYTGTRLAERCLRLGYPVTGFGTRPQSLNQIAATGAHARHLNLDLPPHESLDFDGQLVYYTVPPLPAGMRDARLERWLDRVVGTPARIVYLSTTGVYGDHGGAPVNEETPPQPATERAVRRLAAEQSLRAWADARGVSWRILRVPGIYGPGRLPLDRLRRGEPAIDPREATPGNRIHVDDLVTASLAAGVSAAPAGRVYNVTDGSDDSLTGFLERVARIAGLPRPPLISRADAKAGVSAMAWSFLSESRRVDNRRMLDELGVALAYQDLDAGIRASL